MRPNTLFLLVAAAATCFGLLMASVPLVVRVSQRERMIDADKGLTGSQFNLCDIPDEPQPAEAAPAAEMEQPHVQVSIEKV